MTTHALVSSGAKPPMPIVPEVLCGDARTVMPTLDSTALVVTSPPYNRGYAYDVYNDRLPSHEYDALLAAVFAIGVAL
jgi:hypothetical protein